MKSDKDNKEHEKWKGLFSMLYGTNPIKVPIRGGGKCVGLPYEWVEDGWLERHPDGGFIVRGMLYSPDYNTPPVDVDSVRITVESLIFMLYDEGYISIYSDDYPRISDEEYEALVNDIAKRSAALNK